LPNGESVRNRAGRPTGTDIGRERFLSLLAEGLARLPAHQRQEAKVRIVVRLAGLKLSTAYHYFKHPAFDWPGGRVGWRIVHSLLLERVATERDWEDLLGGLS
jgi:hypothetical protein